MWLLCFDLRVSVVLSSSGSSWHPTGMSSTTDRPRWQTSGAATTRSSVVSLHSWWVATAWQEAPAPNGSSSYGAASLCKFGMNKWTLVGLMGWAPKSRSRDRVGLTSPGIVHPALSPWLHALWIPRRSSWKDKLVLFGSTCSLWTCSCIGMRCKSTLCHSVQHHSCVCVFVCMCAHMYAHTHVLISAHVSVYIQAPLFQ